MVRLRDSYANSCKELMGLDQPPKDSVDRWLLEQLAQAGAGAGAGGSGEPLLPHPQIASSSRVLLRELLAEVPLRCPTRAFGRPAEEALRRYHSNALTWLGRLKGASAELVTAVGELESWIAAHQDQRARRRPDECPHRRKLDELIAVGGLSSRFQALAEPLALSVVGAVNAAAEAAVVEIRGDRDDALGSAAAEVGSVALDLGGDPSLLSAATLRYDGDEIRLSALHYRKLRALYTLHNAPSEQGQEGQAEWEAGFRRRLYVMLRRYITFIGLDPSADGSQGGNMHAAAPESVFAWLQREFEVRCECFASPLNCYFSTFFSAFPDVDAAFGSRGSFFDAPSLPAGSYEVGPPYTEEVLELMARKLLRLLDHGAAMELSFFIFVPDWPGAGGLNLLDGPSFAKYRRAHHDCPFVLAKGREHHYVTGVQFFAGTGADAARRYYTVPHGTRIYVLQTDTGAARWPFTEEQQRTLLERLRAPAAKPDS